MEIRNKYVVKVGGIFHSVWGYNMINHDFYKVIKLKGTTQVVVRRLKTINTRDDGYGQCGWLKMVDEFDENPHFNEEIIKKVLLNYDSTQKIKITEWQTAYIMPKEKYDDEFYFNYLD